MVISVQNTGNVGSHVILDARVIQIHRDVNKNVAPHLGPTVTKQPIFRIIVPILHPTIKKCVGKLVLFGLQKMNVVHIFRGRESPHHGFDDRPLDHHETSRSMFHLGQVIIDREIVIQIVNIVTQETVLDEDFVGHNVTQLRFVLGFDPGLNNIGFVGIGGIADELLPHVVLERIDTSDHVLVRNEKFQDRGGIPGDVTVNKQNMGHSAVVHCAGNQVVTCPRYETVVLTKLDLNLDIERSQNVQGIHDTRHIVDKTHRPITGCEYVKNRVVLLDVISHPLIERLGFEIHTDAVLAERLRRLRVATSKGRSGRRVMKLRRGWGILKREW